MHKYTQFKCISTKYNLKKYVLQNSGFWFCSETLSPICQQAPSPPMRREIDKTVEETIRATVSIQSVGKVNVPTVQQ